MKESQIPPDHPRAESLIIREGLARMLESGVIVPEGLMAHGRGEAFDYLIGEVTISPAHDAIQAAAATLLIANHPVISINGNVAALAAGEVARLSGACGAKVEVNLFHQSRDREEAIAELLQKSGVDEVLGVGASSNIPEVGSNRRKVDPNGILVSDVVLVPLEDGDRIKALEKIGKKVITVDLNPLSQAAQHASITIVDNVVRALPSLTNLISKLSNKTTLDLHSIVDNFDNNRNLSLCLNHILHRIKELQEQKIKVNHPSSTRS